MTGIGLYIHIPFCIRKCLYCDFLSAPAGEDVREAYVSALLGEIQAVPELGRHRVSTLYLGGGTPSLLSPDQLSRILDQVHTLCSFEPAAEITMEANPGTLSAEKLRAIRKAGINRLSLGLQATDNALLSRLGRVHTYEDFLTTYDEARRAGFSNISLDLMFALPGQTLASWQKALHQVCRLAPEHISAYGLMVEEGTPFASMNLDLPDEDTEIAMMEETAQILFSYGYGQYEISNYAKPGFSCRHNLGYWNRTPYLGLGLGAASFYAQERFRNTPLLSSYLQESAIPSHIREDRQLLTPREQRGEELVLGLRLIQGIHLEHFEETYGQSLFALYPGVTERFLNLGLLQIHNGFLSLTRRGLRLSNQVMQEYL